MKIAIEGCMHGELQKVYETLVEIEEREKYKIDLLICCGDFQATRNISDLKCMAVPEKHLSMGSFYKYYSGELKAPVLTIVIGGNHEASNHLQELPFGGWLCPNIYFLGNSGVVDIVDGDNGVILTLGGLSGIYKARDYLLGRYERVPYDENAKRSVYHVRNIDAFRLKSMAPGSIDVGLSHDWPCGITDYGNVEQLLRFKRHFREDIENNALGSPPTMDVLKHLLPNYWFSAHLHCKFPAVYQNKTKFLGLDKCLPNRRFLQVIEEGPSPSGAIKLHYNPHWLSILKSTNHLQSSKRTEQHMPGPGYSQRFDFRPTDEELKVIRDLFKNDLTIPENFTRTAKVFDNPENFRNHLFATSMPSQPQINPQTEEFCEKLGIDDPIRLIDQEKRTTYCSSSLKAADFIVEKTRNDDEIELDDDSDDDEGDNVKCGRGGEAKNVENQSTSEVKKFSMNLPAPLKSVAQEAKISSLESSATHEENIQAVERTSIVENVQAEQPVKKTLKRRNASIYAND